MRIAVISFEFPPETLGGIATYARHATRMLAARGHDVTVFASTAGPDRDEQLDGVRVVLVRCANRRSFHEPAVAQLASVHGRSPFDVAEVPDLYAEARGLRSTVPSLPFILRAHTPVYIPSEIDYQAMPKPFRPLYALRRLCGNLVRRQPNRPLLKGVLARVSFRYAYDPAGDSERDVAMEADLVVPPSQRLARRLERDWKLPADRVRVLPYPHTAAPDLLALRPPANARVIGFHGGMRYFKGVHVLLAAFERVSRKHPDIRLILAGASGMSPVASCSWRAWRKDEMLTWKDTLDWLRPALVRLGDRVVIKGFVPPESLASHLRETDICAFPSLFDNFPSACLEAMSAGRAIVATRSGGMEEMLAGGDAGLLVAPGDARELAAAICRLIEDPGLAGRLAEEARRRLLSEYNPDRIGPLYESTYAEAISRRKSGIA